MNNPAVNIDSLELRPDGRLANLSDWTPEVAIALANTDGLHLTNAHWDIITLIRSYYFTYNISPINRLLKREIARNYGKERANDDYLFSLFPNGVSHQATKIAGVPMSMLDSEREHRTPAKKPKAPQAVDHYTDTFSFNNKDIKVYPTGNLVHLDDWDESLAAHLAQKESISLTEEHWEVIRYLRKFYFQYGITPMVKLLIKHMAEEHGEDQVDEAKLYALFPKGPSRQGSRLAGLPEPQGCIDP